MKITKMLETFSPEITVKVRTQTYCDEHDMSRSFCVIRRSLGAITHDDERVFYTYQIHQCYHRRTDGVPTFLTENRLEMSRSKRYFFKYPMSAV